MARSTTDLLITFNAGSSSIKLGIFRIARLGKVRLLARADLVLTPKTILVRVHAIEESTSEPELSRRFPRPDFCNGLLPWIESTFDGTIIAAGHRVVHGGTKFSGPVLVQGQVSAQLKALIPLAPLHQPLNLLTVEALRRSRPGLPQVATFDTSFHRSLPRAAYAYGIPRRMTEAGIRRFGFHGLSYEFICERLKKIDRAAWNGRTVIAHLGSGASLCAVVAGRSVATTMGFSVLDGLLMATRPGALDPGVLLYLLKQQRYSVERLETFLYRDCGLLGVSGGISPDMRVLHEQASKEAAEAIDLFVYRVCEGIAAMAADAGGIDTLVFTGGIGEQDAVVRRKIADGCRWLGLRISASAGKTRGEARLHTPGSRLKAWVIPTDEESVIARHTAAVLRRC